MKLINLKAVYGGGIVANNKWYIFMEEVKYW